MKFKHRSGARLQRRVRRVASAACLSLLGACLPVLCCTQAHANSFAPIFTYFQVGMDESPAANLRLDQFQAQIDLLKREGFTVASVPDIVASFESSKPIPDRTVGLTFDEANRSILKNTLPLLKQAGFTATIFVTPTLADRGGAYMNWGEISRAARDGFTIGAKIDVDRLEDESPDKLLAAVNESIYRIQQHTGLTPTLFSYSGGIMAPGLREIVRSRGFHAALAMQSGPASEHSDRFMLPRFSMTEAFGTLDRFRVAALSIPLEVIDPLPADQTITGQNPPQIGFTVTGEDVDLSALACFVEDEGKAPLTMLGNRIELRPQDAFEDDDTTRVNCTVPAKGSNAGRWHWLGFNFYVPAAL